MAILIDFQIDNGFYMERHYHLKFFLLVCFNNSLFFIEIELIYNVSGVLHSDSVLYIHIGD